MKSRRLNRGFTLIELITAITVLAIIAAVLLPVLDGAADGYTSAATLRESSERAGYAMDRCLQMLREAPAGTAAGTLDIATAQPSTIIFGDGHGIELTNGELYLRDSASSTSVLCRNVSSFTLSYIGADGISNTASSPTTTHRFYVSITASGVSLSGGAFPRVLVVKP